MTLTLRTVSLVLVLFVAWTRAVSAQAASRGAPEEHLPPNITRLTAFGERASWSPDGRRLAFMSKSFGDAFEIDLRTRLVRLLTGHFRHAGFLRVQYLPNGDYLLIGARDFKDVGTTRDHDQEMWVMNARADAAPEALHQRISEGVAISRTRLRIAWANTHAQYPDSIPDGESVLYVADVVYEEGRPTLVNRKEVIRRRRPECTLEAQDFRRDDSELVYTCYRATDKADVFGIDLGTGAVTQYRKIDDEYNEAEGVSPDGRWDFVESSRAQGPDRQNSRYIDIWRLRLEPNGTDFVRMTRWGDFDGYKASNPVVSPDGKSFAFQSARSQDRAGVGYGILLFRLDK